MSQYLENFDFTLSQFSTQMSEQDVVSFVDELNETELKQAINEYERLEQMRNQMANYHQQARNTRRPSLDTLEKVRREHRILEQDVAGLAMFTVRVAGNKNSPQQFAKMTTQQQQLPQVRSPHARKQGFNQHGSASDPLQQFHIQQEYNSDSPSLDRNDNWPDKSPSKRKEALDQSDKNRQTIHSILYELTVEEFDKSIEKWSSTREVNMPDINAYKSHPKQSKVCLLEQQLQNHPQQVQLHQQQSIGSYQQLEQNESSKNHEYWQGEILLEGSMCAQCKRVCSCFPQF